jgi:hypothetical protein
MTRRCVGVDREDGCAGASGDRTVVLARPVSVKFSEDLGGGYEVIARSQLATQLSGLAPVLGEFDSSDRLDARVGDLPQPG